MKIVVKDWVSLSKYRKFVDDFEKNLYLKYFPNENEREPFNLILERIWNDEWPTTKMVLHVEDDKVIAGCISDYYTECKTIEPIYLVVDEEHRNKGIAKEMLEDVFRGNDIVDMYVEVDNPERVEGTDSAIDPKTRIEIYRKLGFELLDLDYVQPPLDKGMDYERNLLLMYRTKKPPLKRERLVKFITSFYKGLNSLGTSEYFKLIDSIK